MSSFHSCWCGQSQLSNFSPDYALCENCQTLVLKNWPAEECFDVVNEENDFYGPSYYQSHLTRDYAYPSLEARARNDLKERCLHWMRAVLKYQLPPARTLELGSAHGGFVALMRWAGFDAEGLEMNQWLADYARKTFDVPVLTGMLEKQDIKPGSIDLILHFDVLEHLPDPRGTMQRCLDLLRPDGMMIIQTPCYTVGRTHEELVRGNDRFLEQYKPLEHLHLFSKQSVSRLFTELGAPFLYFEPPIFDHYDMFVVVSRRELIPHTEQESSEALLANPQGRIIQSLLDLSAEHRRLLQSYDESEKDRAARLVVINDLDQRYRDLDKRHSKAKKILSKWWIRLLTLRKYK